MSRETIGWALRGFRGLASVPALILMSAMVGFGTLAREADLSLGQTVVATFGIWALPSSIVLVGSISSGLTLLPTALAVALASVRFTPMVMSIMPEMRGSGTRRATLLALSHFVAITAWVHANRMFLNVPRERRTAWFGGFAAGLATLSTLIVAVVHMASASLPPQVAMGLVFLTPIYFLTALWSSARTRTDRPALIAGMALGPLFHVVSPSFGLVAAGLVGGTVVYLLEKRRRDGADAS